MPGRHAFLTLTLDGVSGQLHEPTSLLLLRFLGCPISLGGVRPCNSVCWPLFGLLYHRWMTDNDMCRAVSGMQIGMERSTWGKPAPVPVRPPQISHVSKKQNIQQWIRLTWLGIGYNTELLPVWWRVINAVNSFTSLVTSDKCSEFLRQFSKFVIVLPIRSRSQMDVKSPWQQRRRVLSSGTWYRVVCENILTFLRNVQPPSPEPRPASGRLLALFAPFPCEMETVHSSHQTIRRHIPQHDILQEVTLVPHEPGQHQLSRPTACLTSEMSQEIWGPTDRLHYPSHDCSSLQSVDGQHIPATRSSLHGKLYIEKLLSQWMPRWCPWLDLVWCSLASQTTVKTFWHGHLLHAK
jgi:hypothetical protein